MKKMLMMAIAFMASSMAFAGDSDGLKAIKNCKNYAEAAQLVKQNLASLADNAEKAKAYNHLFELAMNKVSNETGTITENRVALQMGTGKVKPYDTLGLADAICDAINDMIECNKYDQMPNAKGKVKPQFEKNIGRVWAVRANLVDIGQAEALKGNDAAVVKYWGTVVDTAEDPIFAAMDHTLNGEDKFIGQVALFAGKYAFQMKELEKANRYFEVAKRDPEYKTDALNVQLYVLQSSLKTKEDSLNYVNKLKDIYKQESENAVVFENLYNMYNALGQKDAADKMVDDALVANPNNFIALANKGLSLLNTKPGEAVPYMKKAFEIQPQNAILAAYVGTSLSQQAQQTEDETVKKSLYKEAITYFDKAKELDPEKKQANWGYHRLNAYYNFYGPNAPETKAAEADSKK